MLVLLKYSTCLLGLLINSIVELDSMLNSIFSYAVKFTLPHVTPRNPKVESANGKQIFVINYSGPSSAKSSKKLFKVDLGIAYSG